MKKVASTGNVAGQRADRRALAEINDLIDDGVHDAASVLAWEVQRISPGDPAVWLLLARIDYLRERYAAAIYAARMATRLAPSSPDAWFALASTAATRSRWHAEGLDAALQATAHAPDLAKNWTVLAQLQLATGSSYEAAVAAERAVQVNPDYRGGHLMLGEIALHAGEWAHAEGAFRRALALDPSDRDARDGLIEAVEAQDRVPDDELARYGALSTPAHEAASQRAGPSGSSQADSRGRLSFGRFALGAIGVCLLAGLVLGLLVPGLGVVRGLIGAVALILMWVAVRPTRRGSRAGAPDDPLAPDPTEATVASDAPVSDDSGRAGGSVPSEVSVTSDVPTSSDAPAAASNGRHRSDERAAGVPAPATDAAGPPAAAGRGSAPSGEPDVVKEHPPGADGGGGGDREGPDDAADAVGIDMPDDPGELAALSRARLAASDLELAHAAASRLEAVAPGTVEAHRALGAVALAGHDYEQARTHYRQILKLEPLDQEAHERLALIGDEASRSGHRLPLRRLWGRP